MCSFYVRLVLGSCVSALPGLFMDCFSDMCAMFVKHGPSSSDPLYRRNIDKKAHILLKFTKNHSHANSIQTCFESMYLINS